MSADSPRRPRSQMVGASGPHTVSPQQVTDPSIIDSVAGFINDVVPAAYNVPSETKDQVQWAHFEQLDIDDSRYSENLDCDKYIPSPLFIILGYTTGVQVWAVPASGEAVEALSWRHGTVKVLKILPTPYCAGKKNSDDLFAQKRPLIALCDTASPGPHYCSLSILSLKTGEQVKNIKFKNPIIDILANRRSVVVTFAERIAVFDAFSLEDRLTVTTCYLSPGLCSNPVSLGTRWMAYAEKKLISAKRSSGGNDGEGVQSYTATVLHAAKSLGKGLRELGETVASSLTGTAPYKHAVAVPATGQQYATGTGTPGDTTQPGVVTVLDIEHQNNELEKSQATDGFIAHFTAHTEAIVSLIFDPSGQLLLTADKRGHDFHLFRIHPHPSGPALAAVHHLYVLHRGDTTARVQDMCFSPDSRWVTVSTLRGTTHVFPVTPYGGPVGVRTHATPHVVNRLSRFHRSAGLPAEGRSNSPVSLFEAPVNSSIPFNNPRLPPFPHPTIVHALAQIRQSGIGQSSSSVIQRNAGGRQRLTSSSEDSLQVALRVRACFATARAWMPDSINQGRDTCPKAPKRSVESLFVMSCHGTLVQYDLDPRHSANIPKEKVCDDTPIDLIVEPKAQWMLQRQPNTCDMQLPLHADNLLLLAYRSNGMTTTVIPNHNDDRWLSQVEIVTHAGPHRRLWMGPQFTFKTYNTSSGAPLSVMEAVAIDVGRSKPVNMPLSAALPVLIESGSASSCEQSPRLVETCNNKTADDVSGPGELQLREDLADAMLESPGVREAGGRCVIVSMKHHITGAGHSVAKVVNPLGTVVTLQSDDDAEPEVADDAVIHENCDEALFRPVVAPKAVLFAEPPKRCVQPKVIRSEPPCPIIIQPDPIHSDALDSFDFALAHNDVESEPTPEFGDTFEFPVINNEETTCVSKFFSEPLEPINFPPIVEKVKLVVHEDECKANARVLSSVDLHKYQGLEPDEIVFALEDLSGALQPEEKLTTKRNRKPKSKLGVRISSNVKDLPPPATEPATFETNATTKKSWSSIAASKPPPAPPTSVGVEKPIDFELAEIETIEHSLDMLNIQQTGGDKMICGKSRTFELNSDSEIEMCNVVSQAEPLLSWPDDTEVDVATLIKIDKSSDEDQNVNTNSSQTESDDSSKVRIETTTAATTAMDTEEDGCVADNKSAITSSVTQSAQQKVAKKKSKKKRR